MATIFHIATRADWGAAQQRGEYVADSLATEGFIHCSTAAQLLPTANALFRGRTDLLLLTLDDARIEAELRYEPPATTAHEANDALFPHVYGPLNLGAVVLVEDFGLIRTARFTADRLGVSVLDRSLAARSTRTL